MSHLCFAFKALGILGLALTLSVGNVVGDDSDKGVMTIGSKAPDIDIEHWVSDNDGAFEHTAALKSGQVYVIEFWATWCGPCIGAMPHIADLQKEYGDAIQVISVSDEDLETVESFLDREVRGKESMTYGELTSTYCLTTDPDESVKKDYFLAAGRTGIPCAFIVGKTGIVEWIGHPMAMDKPLKDVVSDEWDREEFLVAYKKEQEERKAAAKARRMMAKVGRKLQGLVRDGENKEAVDYIDELLENDEFKAAHSQLSTMKLQLMVTNNMEGADKALNKFAKENSDNTQLLNQIAWAIYEQFEKDKEATSKSLLKSACNCAKMAADAEPESGPVLDTYAHLVYAAYNDLDKAIEIQKRAVEHAGSQEDEIKPFLDKLMEEKEGKK